MTAPAPVLSGKWQLVPVEPTEKMLRALYDEPAGARSFYKAMLAAAPPASSADVIEGMREALRPFAELLEQLHPSAKNKWKLEQMVLCGDMHLGELTIGDLRKAKAALALPDSKPDNQGGA